MAMTSYSRSCNALLHPPPCCLLSSGPSTGDIIVLHPLDESPVPAFLAWAILKEPEVQSACIAPALACQTPCKLNSLFLRLAGVVASASSVHHSGQTCACQLDAQRVYRGGPISPSLQRSRASPLSLNESTLVEPTILFGLE